MRRALAWVMASALMAEPAAALERGVYFGCAESGDAMVPVATTIEDDGRNLTGAYVFVEQDGTRTRGWLMEGTREPGGAISFVWEDKYGKGKLVIREDEGGDGITGAWANPDGQGSHIWWGKRGKKLDLGKIDCGERGQT